MDKKERKNLIVKKMKEEIGDRFCPTYEEMAEKLSDFHFEDITVWLEPEYGEWFFDILYKNDVLLSLVTNMDDFEYMWSVSRGCEIHKEDGFPDRFYATNTFVRGTMKFQDFYKKWKRTAEPIYVK